MEFKNTLLTPISLWEDFDDGLPLKSAFVNAIKVDGIVTSEVYFSGRAVGSDRVRIYGYFSHREQNDAKGVILYLPAEDEFVGADSFKEFISEGYSVLAVDLYGRRDGATNFTEYPESVNYANLSESGSYKNSVLLSAKETSWYEWVAVGRYAVKFLKEQGYSSICVVGNKTGANVGWQLVAFDENTDCFVALFGAGWTAYKGVSKFNENEPIEADEASRKYVAAVDAHAYAPYVKRPVLYLTSTNGRFFDFDRAGDTLTRIDKNTPCFYNCSVGYDESLDVVSKNDIVAFLAAYCAKSGCVMPKNDELTCAESDNFVEFKLNGASDINRVTFYVGEGETDARSRNWVEYEVEPDKNGGYSLRYKPDGKGIVFAFASISFENGITLCTKETFCRTEKTAVKRTNSKLIYSGKIGLNGLTFIDDETSVGLFADKKVEEIAGPDDIIGAYSADGLKSYKLSDEEFSLTDASILKFDVFAKEYCPLTLTLYEDCNDGSVKKYTESIEFKAENIWQNALVKISEFKSELGQPVRNYDKITAVSIRSDASFIVNNVLII